MKYLITCKTMLKKEKQVGKLQGPRGQLSLRSCRNGRHANPIFICQTLTFQESAQ